MARTRGAEGRAIAAVQHMDDGVTDPPHFVYRAPAPAVAAPEAYESGPDTWEKNMEAWEVARLLARALVDLGVFPLVIGAAEFATLPADLKRHFRARRETPARD